MVSNPASALTRSFKTGGRSHTRPRRRLHSMGPKEVTGGRTTDGRPLVVVSQRDHIPENLCWPASSQIARAASALLNAQSGHPEPAGALHDGRCPGAEIGPQSQCTLCVATAPRGQLSPDRCQSLPLTR
jgi:hypothetical protein